MRRSRTKKILSAVRPELVPKQLFSDIKRGDRPNSNKDKVESWLLSNDFSYFTEIEKNTSKYSTIQNNQLSVETKVDEAIYNFNTIQNNDLNVDTIAIGKPVQSIVKDSTIQKDFDILDLDSMEFVIDNGSVIQSEQNISSTELVISESTQIPVPNFPITVTQVGPDLDSQNEELIPLSSDELMNYGTARKKRQPKSVPDPKSWKKNESKRRRLMGEMYTGYRRINKEKTRMVQDTPKQERKMGPTCQSKLCSKQKTKNCDQISEQQRAALFDRFWKEMTWPEKKCLSVQ